MDLHAVLHASSLNLAYLDGGTGSMMLQAAIAGMLSLAFVAKTRWNQLKLIVSAKFGKKPSSSR
jgi:hypothetical protein